MKKNNNIDINSRCKNKIDYAIITTDPWTIWNMVLDKGPPVLFLCKTLFNIFINYLKNKTETYNNHIWGQHLADDKEENNNPTNILASIILKQNPTSTLKQLPSSE